MLELGADTKASHLPATAVGYLAYASRKRDSGDLVAILEMLSLHGHYVSDTVVAHIDDDPVHDTPLHIAIRIGAQPLFLAKLIELGADMDEDGGFGTPLLHAQLLDNEAAVQFLVERDARAEAGKYNLVQLAALGWFEPPFGKVFIWTICRQTGLNTGFRLILPYYGMTPHRRILSKQTALLNHISLYVALKLSIRSWLSYHRYR